MDIAHAYTYIKDDPDWMKKVGFGALVVLGGIILFPIFFILYGYQIEVTRRVMAGEKSPLPEWDFGAMFMDGLYLAIGRFVYSLPALLPICIGIGAFFALGAGGAATGDENVMAILGSLGTVVYCIGIALAMFLVLVLAFIVPALNVQYVRSGGELSGLFQIREVLGIARANIGNIIWIFLAVIGAQFVISIVSSVLSWTICIPLILAFAGPVWISIANGHLFGQMGVASEGKMGMG